MSRFRRIVVLLVGAALVALAAPAGAASGNGLSVTLHTLYQGRLRSLNLYVAPRVPTRTPVPLLIVLHGLSNDPATVEAASGLDAVADSQDVALAYPQGYGGSWNAGGCCGQSRADGVDDVGFLTTAVSLIATLRPIDLSRVYVAGFSNGGMMALRALCDRPDVFAAAVSIAGPLEVPCTGSVPVSAMLLQGQRDATIPYDGEARSRYLGIAIPPARVTIARLARRSGCVVAHQSAARNYVRLRYTGCLRGTSVELLTVPSLGHRWPDLTRDRVDGGALTWTFLQAQRRAAS